MTTTTQNEPQRLPPQVDGAFDIDVNEASFRRMWTEFQQHGAIYRIEPPHRKASTYVLNHPDLVQHVLSTNYKNYQKGIGFERVKLLLGNGLICSDGAFWKQQRQMLQPSFHKPSILNFAGTMQRSNARKLEEWKGRADRGEEIDVTHETSELALDTILDAIFGDDLAWLSDKLGGNPFTILVDEGARDLELVLRFRQLRKPLTELIERRRSEGIEADDFVGRFLKARDKQSGAEMPAQALIDEILTLVVAGHETTAATLNWIWYLLSQHPEVERKVHEAVDALGDGVELAGVEHLQQLDYLRLVMEEALRLYPPVWLFTRKAKADDTIGGYHVPAGTDVLLSPWIVHRHPEFWDDPESFRPERHTREAASQRHKFAYFPFSQGARRCIGDFFATVEAQLHVATIARQLRLRYVGPQPVELEPAVNLRARHGLRMVVEPR